MRNMYHNSNGSSKVKSRRICLPFWNCFRIYNPPISPHLVSSPKSESVEDYCFNGSHEALTIPKISIDQIKKVTTNFGSDNRLDGTYARIYYGVLRDGTEEVEVAFKKIIPSNEQDVEEFYSQVSVLSNFKHDNIVKILGYCIDDALWILALEYANSRSLYDALYGQRGVYKAKLEQVLVWKHRVKIAFGVAKALHYLHEKAEQHPMRHGNIKSSNVLLFTNDDGEVTAKLSDLRPPINEADGSMLHSNVLGSFGYEAPEFAMTGSLTIKSDIYSYGIILLELLTGRKPIDRSVEKGKQSLVTWCTPMLKNKVHECMDPKLEGNYDERSIIKIAAIASLCLQFDAAFRPNTLDILRSLRSLSP